MAVSDYKTVADQNTTISGINIAEGCPPSGINNAIRQMMADIKAKTDAIETAQSAAISAVQTAQATKDAAQDIAISNAQNTADAAQNAADAAQNAADKAQETADSAVPVGTIMYTASSALPDGYLTCNGALVSRTTYQDLFNAIGETYGAGDGSTTFALPNLMGKVAWGDNIVGTEKAAGLPNIEGKFGGANAEQGGAFTNIGNASSKTSGAGWGESVNHTFTFDASKSNSIYGNSTTVQPPALTLLPVIKF